jgi:ABC-type glycerol-3-phosphate transport system substrate-binding protein
MNKMPRHRLALLGALCLGLAACAGPVSATRADPEVVLRGLGRSAITTGESSLC